jgi:hypothetical protein
MDQNCEELCLEKVTVKLGYNKLLGTVQICSLLAGFAITGKLIA